MKDHLARRSSYNYELPEELIAQYPVAERSTSRLLYLDKNKGDIEHKVFTDIIDYLRPDDVLVVNRTRVIPARLFGKKETGAQVEVLLLDQKNENTWECLVRPGRRLKPGSEIFFSDQLKALVTDYSEDGSRLIKFLYSGNFWDILENTGNMPLPPYIHRAAEPSDKKTYQTVYAQERGSVAAPTAGLHFTPEILENIKEMGIEILEVILRVGLGTFRPVKSENIIDHKMHSEYCEISEDTAAKINKAKAENRRIIAVGTTTTRTLESFATDEILKSGSHWTEIFIYPGKKLQIIDGLLTNFHMPESTLMMLVSAFAGYENIMNAYKIAVAERYRFFSYGDAMLIL